MGILSGIIPWKKRRGTPTIIQMEAVECGAAALAMILAYYGRYATLEELRLRCGVSRDGVNAFNMIKAAESYGMEAAGYKVDADNLRHLILPAILYWDYNHFVVLEGFGLAKVYINDPALGPREISYQELKAHYTHVAIELKPGPGFTQGGTKPSLWESVKARLAPFKPALGYLLLIQVCLSILALTLPAFFQFFIDKILGEGLFTWKGWFIALLAGVMALTGWFTWRQADFLNRLRTRLAIHYSVEYLWHILRLPLSFYTQRVGGEIVYRMNLNNNVADLLTGQLAMALINLSFIAIYAWIMVQYDVLIAGIGIAAALYNLFLVSRIGKIRSNAYARFQQEQAKIIGVSLDALQHIETMKLCSNGAHFFSNIAGNYARNINSLQDIAKKDSYLSSLSFLSQQLSSIALLGIGVWRVMGGHLTIGMLIGLQVLLNLFFKPFSQLTSFGTSLQSLKMDLNRLDDVLQNREDPLFANPDPLKDAAEPLKGALDLKDVSFGYQPLAPPFIENIHLSIPPGKWLGLAGGIGSGKSTLAKLACQLMQPMQGSILYDGKPFSAFSRDAFSKAVAYVDQQTVLFSGTIKDNLALWDESIPLETCIEAAKDACIHDEILARTGGYYNRLTENGRNYSEGQRQRMEIARALVRNPAILILDEATSSIDSHTEAQILGNIRKRGCTCLVISHRLNTLSFCDEVAVIEKGKIVQLGRPDELRRQSGTYQKLFELGEGQT